MGAAEVGTGAGFSVFRILVVGLEGKIKIQFRGRTKRKDGNRGEFVAQGPEFSYSECRTCLSEAISKSDPSAAERNQDLNELRCNLARHVANRA